MSSQSKKSITVLPFKICETDVELDPVAEICRKARNVAIEDWLLRQRGMPESEKQVNPNSESGKLYHAIGEKVPELFGTQTASKIAGDVSSYLTGKLDWRRGFGEDGKRRKRQDAILDYEDRPPFFHCLEVPVHNKECSIKFGDETVVTLKRVTRNCGPINLKLSLRELPPRYKKILQAISKGHQKLACSKLVQKKNGQWYWFLPVDFEQPSANPDTQVTLYPVVPNIDGDPERPFRIESENHKRNIGDGRYLIAQMRRYESIIKRIGYHYKNRRNGAGHGRKDYDKAVKKHRRNQRNHVDEVRRRAIKGIVDYARRNEAGVVVYREPTGPAKEKCWFDRNGLTWDWTRFASDLKNSLAKHGIELRIKKLKIGEIVKAKKEKKDAA